jgi:hypothetical protein
MVLDDSLTNILKLILLPFRSLFETRGTGDLPSLETFLNLLPNLVFRELSCLQFMIKDLTRSSSQHSERLRNLPFLTIKVIPIHLRPSLLQKHHPKLIPIRSTKRPILLQIVIRNQIINNDLMRLSSKVKDDRVPSISLYLILFK